MTPTRPPSAGPFTVTSYISNHARTGAAVWYRVVDGSGGTVRKGFRVREAAERAARFLTASVSKEEGG